MSHGHGRIGKYGLLKKLHQYHSREPRRVFEPVIAKVVIQVSAVDGNRAV